MEPRREKTEPPLRYEFPEEAPMQPAPEPAPKPPRRGMLTLIQMAACLAVLLACAVLRLLGGPLYEQARAWYWENLNRSILAGEGAPPEEPASSAGEDAEEVSSSALLLTHAAGSSCPAALSVALTPPVAGAELISGFGERDGAFHEGLDLAAPEGTPVCAALPGTVAEAGWSDSYGYTVLLDHGNGIQTRYAHCSALEVSAGQEAARGQEIARVGSTGDSSGPHLHFELSLGGAACDPLPLLGGD